MQWPAARVVLISTLGGLAVACGAEIPVAPRPAVPEADPIAVARNGQARAQAKTACPLAPFANMPLQAFSGEISRQLSTHSHHHGAPDVIVLPGMPATLQAWFDYGVLMTPLAGEEVQVFSYACGAATDWQPRGTLTTALNGHAAIQVDTDTSSPNRTDIVFEVEGDGTQAQAALYVLPATTHFVVFDIDGTLSRNNRDFLEEIAEHLAHREVWPQAFVDAAKLTHLWQDKGYVPLYLTNRPHQLADITRAWLALEGFAEGPLLVSTLMHDMLPLIDGAGNYKLGMLRMLRGRGYSVDYAYGNEPTDIYAYSHVGVPMPHVFSIGTHAGLAGSQPIAGGYTDHLGWVAHQPNIFKGSPSQPLL